MILRKFPSNIIEQHKEDPNNEMLPSAQVEELPIPQKEIIPESVQENIEEVKSKKSDSDQTFTREKRNRKFTREEDEKLKNLVKTYGEGAWSKIAEEMDGRNRKQVRERYINFLKKERVVTEFTPEEDATILQFVQENGRKWSSLAELLVGKTPIMIKNRYYAKLRRSLKGDDKNKLKVDTSSLSISLQQDSSTGELTSPANNFTKLKKADKESLERLKEQEKNMKLALAEVRLRIERIKATKSKT